MLTLVLPELVAGRDLADAMVDRLAGPLDGETVAVDGRGLASGSPSFASQLVHRILSEGGAAEMILIGSPQRFTHYVADSANVLGVASRLQLSEDTSVATASV